MQKFLQISTFYRRLKTETEKSIQFGVGQRLLMWCNSVENATIKKTARQYVTWKSTPTAIYHAIYFQTDANVEISNASRTSDWFLAVAGTCSPHGWSAKSFNSHWEAAEDASERRPFITLLLIKRHCGCHSAANKARRSSSNCFPSRWMTDSVQREKGGGSGRRLPRSA